ncbi:MAG: bacillithiol biosynthesis cysteine-adding enzyme BshC [Acidobacteria bacterium]|nr:bacillithiol biosynthesis cysteine-adding enzyme BshC [Acidobacteriota bacterium]
MDSHCIPFTAIPHTTALFSDYLYRFEKVAAFYAHDPFEPASFARAAEKMALETERRRAVASILAEQNERFGADETTLAAIRRLADGAAAVVTGQQVGLFGGPAYSIYKALTAIRLAENLTAQGIRAVPIFWLASEDHDLDEVNHCVFLDADGRFVLFEHASTSSPNTPVGRVRFDASIEDLRRRAARLWPPEAAEEAESLLAGYVPGATYADSFARLLLRLFAGRGLIVLDPLHPTLHALARPVFRRALEEAERLHKLLRARDRELRRAGYHLQVRLQENATLLFLTVDGQRLPLRRREDEFSLSGQAHRSLAALLEELEAAPERFSPNVLLRSVVQDWLLPTVAYVAGPNETTYFAQTSVLYDELLGRMPVIVPRSSVTLVDPRAQRLLRKYGLAFEDLFRGRAALEVRMAERLLPRGLARRLESAQARMEKLLGAAAEEVARLDPTLHGAVETSRHKMLYQFEKIRRKAARAQAERAGLVDRHREILFNSCYPEKGLQERRLAFLSFVARHGRALVDRLLEQVNYPCRDHQVIFL